jgi:UDP-N-acetylmuramate dehydrogenase
LKNILDILKTRIDTNDIFENEPMSKHTTFKVGGKADIFIKVHEINNLKFILKVAKEYNIDIFILGNGSNLLVKDKGIRGITLKIEIKKIDIIKEKEYIKVIVGAGEKNSIVAHKLKENEVSGFEFAAGIPGTIGGLVRMNAGAHKKEAKDIVINSKVMDYNGKIFSVDNKQHKFGYRNSVFCDEKFIILETTLKLKYGKKKEIEEIQNEYLKYRREKQPLNYPNAGSTFKRGDNFITAQLIDECGLKGLKIGGAEVSTKHAGFIINTGDATAKDVINLVEKVQEIVYKKTQKKIYTEIEIVGED